MLHTCSCRGGSNLCRASQEVHGKTGELEATFPKSWVQSDFPALSTGSATQHIVPVTGLSKCITFSKKGDQLIVVTVFLSNGSFKATFWFLSPHLMFAVEYRGTVFRYQLV